MLGRIIQVALAGSGLCLMLMLASCSITPGEVAGPSDFQALSDGGTALYDGGAEMPFHHCSQSRSSSGSWLKANLYCPVDCEWCDATGLAEIHLPGQLYLLLEELPRLGRKDFFRCVFRDVDSGECLEIGTFRIPGGISGCDSMEIVLHYDDPGMERHGKMWDHVFIFMEGCDAADYPAPILFGRFYDLSDQSDNDMD